MRFACRHCGSPVERTLIDLGFAPPSNAYRGVGELDAPETYLPLRVGVCETCFLVQTQDYARSEQLFASDYAYFSSTSARWVEHARRFAQAARARFALGADSLVLEAGSNDGYLLRHFQDAAIPCLGVEPTASTAAAARALGLEVIEAFFGESLAADLAAQGRRADLVVANNVYAHVPDINDFTRGLAGAIKPDGVIALEFPHLVELIDQCQFDTIYHEHFSYLSLTVVERIFAAAGLRVFDVDFLPTHGGSLRVFGCRNEAMRPRDARVDQLLQAEADKGVTRIDYYEGFQAEAERRKNAFLGFLLEARAQGARVAAYGAAAKGNTLINFAGIKPDLLGYVCDAAAAKQGQYLPGSHIPILPPDQLERDRPDIVVLLPWNIAEELADQLRPMLKPGAKLVTVLPEVREL